MATSVLPAKGALGYMPGLRGAQKPTRAPYDLPQLDECTHCQASREGFFCQLSPTATRALNQIRRSTSYPAGAVLYLEGEAARGVYLVCHGRVKLMTASSEGKTLIVKIAGPGEVLGLHAALSGSKHETSVETLQPTQVSYINREDFLRFIKDHSEACLRVAQHLGRDCHSAYELVRSIGLSNSVPEKLARFLSEWSAGGQLINGFVRTKLSLTHEEMAQLIGCSRESVSRALSDFRRQGLIELNGATLTLRNKAEIERLGSI